MSHTRQLAAIMFTDVKGFSEMMEKDEPRASVVRDKVVNAINTNVSSHQGRVISFAGDGSLCMFNSAIEAVRAAISIQRVMKEEPRVPLRIGIHSGDVMIEENEIYGEGVNVASRVESFSVPGGVLISARVNDEIKNQPDIHTVSVGRYVFKNIKEPVELFAVSNHGIAVPPKNSLEGKGIALADQGTFSRKNIRWLLMSLGVAVLFLFGYYKFIYASSSSQMKSIAVMPFKNMNNDSTSEFLSNGITEDILTHVSRISDLNVISNSTMSLFKNSNKSPQEIGNELNAGSILEGTVRRMGNKIRIFVQLIDASSGKNVWAETYERDYSKVFDIQSEIAQIIALVLKAELSPDEKRRIQQRPTQNLTAYEFYLKGREHYLLYQAEDNERAIDYFKKALQLDQNYALAWAGLSDAFSQKGKRHAFDKSWIDSGKVAANRAIQLDSASAEGYKALATAYNYSSDYNTGFQLLQKAVGFNPNYAPAVGNLGTGFFLRGDMVNALKWQKKAAALNPKNSIPFQITGWFYRVLGDYEQAKLWLLKSIELKPIRDSYRELAFTYQMEGNNAEAVKLIPLIVQSDTTNYSSYEEAALVYLQARDFREAKGYFQKAVEMNKSLITDAATVAPIGLGAILLKEGKKIDAEILLSRSLALCEKEIENGSTDDEPRIGIAAIMAVQGKKDKAIYWLQKAIDDGNWLDYGMVETNPWFDNVSSDPRFKQVISKVKAKVSKMRKESDVL